MPYTQEQMSLGLDDMIAAMDRHGISTDSLARLLKQGLKAKVTKTMKVKGLIRQEDLPKGFRVIATSGTVIYDKDGNPEASTGETVIAWNEISNDERRQNRIDAQRLRNLYPAEKREIEHKGRGMLIIERTGNAGSDGKPGTDPT